MCAPKARAALLRALFGFFCVFLSLDILAAETIAPADIGTCEPSPPPLERGSTPTYPGRWWNPARFGTGWDFLYSPLLDAEGKFAVYWFTFDSRGTPTWLIGTMRRTTSADGHLRSIGTLYLPYFEYNAPAADGRPYNAVTRVTKVGELSVVFPNGTSTRAAIRWNWTENGSLYEGQECIYDAFRDQPPLTDGAGENPGLNQAFTANWFDPTRALRGIGSWGFDLVIGRTPADGMWHEIVTAQVYDVNGKPVWLQYANPTAGQPALDNRTNPGNLLYTRAGSGYPNGVPNTSCTADDQANDSKCVKHVLGRTLDSQSNYLAHVFTGANAGKIELRVNIPPDDSRVGRDPAVTWPPVNMDLANASEPHPYADPGANVPVARTTEVNRIIADRTLCVVQTVGGTCHIVVSYSTNLSAVYIEKRNLDTNVPTLFNRQGQFNIIEEDLPVGSRFKYSLRMNDGSNTVLSETAEVRVVGRMNVPDATPVPLDGDLPVHQPEAGSMHGVPTTEGGTANYTIPIVVPPGRAGMQPQIAVSYSSRGGNGIAGMGTSISGASSIHRCAKTKAQDGMPRAVTFDADDALCLDGQRLMAVEGVYGQPNAVYRTEVDSFTRVKQYGPLTGNSCFTAELKTGQIQYFGVVPVGDSCPKLSSAAYVKPLGVGSPKTLNWLLVKVEDRTGNAMTYSYDSSDAGIAREQLLRSIRYTDLGATAGDRWVRFDYQARASGANDYGVGAMGGGYLPLSRRLSRIYTQVGDKTVRQYEFTYDAPSSHSGRSLLRQVKECAFADRPPYTPTCHPSTMLSWAELAPGTTFTQKERLRPLSIAGLPVVVPPKPRELYPAPGFDPTGPIEDPESPDPGSTATDDYLPLSVGAGDLLGLEVMGDLDGDGSREVFAKVRTGTGPNSTAIYNYVLMRTTPDRTFADPVQINLGDLVVLQGLDDFDGDGIGDSISPPRASEPQTFHLVRWKGERGAWPAYNPAAPATFDSLFDRIAIPNITAGNAMSLEKVADFDGDGRPDALFRRKDSVACAATQAAWNQMVVFLNRTTRDPAHRGDFVEGPSRCLTTTQGPGGLIYGDLLQEVSDFDGDGRSDVMMASTVGGLTTTTGLVRVRPVNGVLQMDFEDVATLGLSGVVATAQHTIRWIDLNGDGLADFLTAQVGAGWRVQLNLGNARFSTPINVSTIGDVGLQGSGGGFKYNGAMPVSDVDGDGRPELLRPQKVAAALCPRYRRNTCLDNPGGGGACDVFACPDDPTDNPVDDPSTPYDESVVRRVVPPGEMLEGFEVKSLYRDYGGANADPSAYVMNAVKFVFGPLDANGLPTITAVDTPTGIVTTLAQANRSADLYGDGLTDMITVLGCNDCAAAAINGNDPRRPWTLPNGQSVNVLVGQYRVYVNENTGAGERPAGTAHRLPDLVSGVTDGLGNQVLWEYSPLSSRAGRSGSDLPLYTIPNAANSYVDDKHFYVLSSMPVVESMWQSNGLAAPNDMLGSGSYSYAYGEGMYNNEGRGFLGFRSITSQQETAAADAQRGVRTTTTFAQKFPLAGSVERVETYALGTPVALASAEENHWQSRSVAPNVVQIFLNDSVVTHYDPIAANVCSFAFARWVSRKSTYNRSAASVDGGTSGWDNYGNLTNQQVVTEDGACDKFVQRHLTSTTSVYDTSAGQIANWWLDRISSKTVSTEVTYSGDHPVPNGQSTSQTSQTTYTWNADRTADSQSQSSGGSWSTSTYGYASPNGGQPTSVTTTASGVTGSRTKTTLYDPDAYFATETTNALGQVTKTQSRARDGVATKTTDINGMVTYSTYDDFGRNTQSIRMTANELDVVEPPTRIAWRICSAGNCGPATGEAPASQALAAYRVTTVKDGSPTKIVWYDAHGREIKSAVRGYDPRTSTFSLTSSPWVQTLTEYDAFGKAKRKSTPHCLQNDPLLCNQADSPLQWSDFEYGVLDRLTKKRQPAAMALGSSVQRTLSTSYEYFGNRTQIRMAENLAKACTDYCYAQRSTNALGELMSTVDFHGGVTRHWYDSAGNPIALEDAEGTLSRAVFDGLGRRTQMFDANQGNWSFVYNGYGEVVSQTDARQVTSTMVYDALGRLTRRTATQPAAQGGPAAAEVTVDTFAFDDLVSPPSPAPLHLGLLKEAARTVAVGAAAPVLRWKEAYHYDARERMEQIDTTIPAVAPLPFETQVEYDDVHNREKVKNYPSGLRIETRYTAYGQVAEVRDADLLQTYWHIDAVNAWGNVRQQTYGNNTVGVFQANKGSGQTASRAWYLGGINGVEQDSVAYGYDVFGDLTSMTRVFPQQNGTIGSFAENYTLDALHRLTKSQRQEITGGSVGPVTTVNLGYDGAGNLLWKDDYSAVGTGMPYPYQYHATKRNAVVSVAKPTGGNRTYAYDANGNLIGQATSGDPNLDTNEIVATYDAGNLARSVKRRSQPVITFEYDANGKRYLETDSGAKVTLPFGMEGAPGKWRHELGDTIVERTMRNGQPLDGTNVVRYPYRDRLGSTLAIADGFGQIAPAQRLDYDAFGKPREAGGGPRPSTTPVTSPKGLLYLTTITDRGFTGQKHVDNAQLIHMNGRMYDFSLGRFLSADPYIQEPSNSQSPNAYSYIMNNPLGGTDPSGYWARKGDNLRQCFGNALCQAEEDRKFLGGAAGQLRDSLTEGGVPVKVWNGRDDRSIIRGRPVRGTVEVGPISQVDETDEKKESTGLDIKDGIMVAQSGGRGTQRPVWYYVPYERISAREAPVASTYYLLLARIREFNPTYQEPQTVRGPNNPTYTEMLNDILRRDLSGYESAAIARFGGPIPGRVGDLLPWEMHQIQEIVNRAERPLDVIGSAARSARRGVGTSLPIGKEKFVTRSDIDYTTPVSYLPYFDQLQYRLPSPGTPIIIPGGSNPFIGPGIRFAPYQGPYMIATPEGQ